MMSGRQRVDRRGGAVLDRCNLSFAMISLESIEQQAVLTLPFEQSGLKSLDKIF